MGETSFTLKTRMKVLFIERLLFCQLRSKTRALLYSLRRKRFQSNYYANVGARAKSIEEGEGFPSLIHPRDPSLFLFCSRPNFFDELRAATLATQANRFIKCVLPGGTQPSQKFTGVLWDTQCTHIFPVNFRKPFSPILHSNITSSLLSVVKFFLLLFLFVRKRDVPFSATLLSKRNYFPSRFPGEYLRQKRTFQHQASIVRTVFFSTVLCRVKEKGKTFIL